MDGLSINIQTIRQTDGQTYKKKHNKREPYKQTIKETYKLSPNILGRTQTDRQTNK